MSDGIHHALVLNLHQPAGNLEHLRANVASLLKPPLPEADRQQLAALFGHLLGVGLELPDSTPKP